MIQRKTQDFAFWRNEYKVDESDHEFLYETLADAAEPQAIQDLALMVIARRCRNEETKLRNELARGLVYDPGESYKVGDMVVFPAFNFRAGRVERVRPGENPEHAAFDVIHVRFEDTGRERMFAAHLATPHALNRHGQVVSLGDEVLLTPAELHQEIGDVVAERLLKHLGSNPKFFINAGALWLTTDQMTEVNLGHLNIAEAAIEMAGKPVLTSTLLETLDLDRTSAQQVRVFSLENALYQDERFIQVGAHGAPAWYLRRLAPAAALAMPSVLRFAPVTYERAALDVELLQTEWEINDELTDGGLGEGAPPMVASTSVSLIYPHLAAGTLPMPPSVRAILSSGPGPCTAVTLVDGRWGTRFPGWVASNGRYLAGLKEWYEQHKLGVGARLTLERAPQSDEVVIDFRPQRAKREWMRTAYLEDGRLAFQVQRFQIGYDYDEHLVIIVVDAEGIAEYRQRLAEAKPTVAQLVRMILPELAKLSPQGTVHVKSLYSAINLVRRLPPGPIFAALAQMPDVKDTGSGYWSL